MGGNATQPQNQQYSPHWYAQRIELFRSPKGFAESWFSITVAFGEYLQDTDPVAGNQLFDVWGTRTVTITGEGLLVVVAGLGLSQEEQQNLLASLLATDTQLSTTTDTLLGILKQANVFDDTAIAR